MAVRYNNYNDNNSYHKQRAGTRRGKKSQMHLQWPRTYTIASIGLTEDIKTIYDIYIVYASAGRTLQIKNMQVESKNPIRVSILS